VVEDGHMPFASDLAALLHVVGKAARDEDGAHFAALAHWHTMDPASYLEDMSVVMEFLPGNLRVVEARSEDTLLGLLENMIEASAVLIDGWDSSHWPRIDGAVENLRRVTEKSAGQPQ
jgi:hypothetical protein